LVLGSIIFISCGGGENGKGGSAPSELVHVEQEPSSELSLPKTISSIDRYVIGGTVSGLSATGLVIQNNGSNNLIISSNGEFNFPAMDEGSSYLISIVGQPTKQTCTVLNQSGLVSGADISDVEIDCVDNPPDTYSIGGTVLGLSGSGFVIQNNGEATLSISENGIFNFPALADGSSYSVTIVSQPTHQTCSISREAGVLAGKNIIDIEIRCVMNRYHLEGTVSGLSSAGLVLQNNGMNPLEISTDGPFRFLSVDDGSNYAVTVYAHPVDQTCSILNGSGIVSGKNISNIRVDCVNNPIATYAIRGTVSGLLGEGLAIQNNAGKSFPISTNGPFSFPPMDDGSQYDISILSQPQNQACTVLNGKGTLSGVDISNVEISCVSIAPPCDPDMEIVSGKTTFILMARFFAVKKKDVSNACFIHFSLNGKRLFDLSSNLKNESKYYWYTDNPLVPSKSVKLILNESDLKVGVNRYELLWTERWCESVNGNPLLELSIAPFVVNWPSDTSWEIKKRKLSVPMSTSSGRSFDPAFNSPYHILYGSFSMSDTFSEGSCLNK